MRFHTINDAAAIFGVHRQTIQGWIKDGTLDALQFDEPVRARGVRISQDEIDRVLASRTPHPTPDTTRSVRIVIDRATGAVISSTEAAGSFPA